MAKVTGLGGVMYKVADPQATINWYQQYLGIDKAWGAMFPFSADPDGYSVVEPQAENTQYFNPSTAQLMIDYRVDDLDGMVAQLQAKGIEILGQETESDGKFAWIMDCDGIKIELWQQIGPAPGPGEAAATRRRPSAAQPSAGQGQTGGA